jgi:hypothetical protein
VVFEEVAAAGVAGATAGIVGAMTVPFVPLAPFVVLELAGAAEVGVGAGAFVFEGGGTIMGLPRRFGPVGATAKAERALGPGPIFAPPTESGGNMGVDAGVAMETPNAVAVEGGVRACVAVIGAGAGTGATIATGAADAAGWTLALETLPI